jgi:hypothetical protein
LLLDARRYSGSAYEPWGTGELLPERMSSPEAHDPAALLAGWWTDYTVVDEAHDPLPPTERLAVTAPFGRDWPGLAPSREASVDPDVRADEYAQHLGLRCPQLRLGLVAAASGADALTAAGWDGPVNYDNDTAKFSAVIRTWE